VLMGLTQPYFAPYFEPYWACATNFSATPFMQ
jgi:hypothetical protein